MGRMRGKCNAERATIWVGHGVHLTHKHCERAGDAVANAVCVASSSRGRLFQLDCQHECDPFIAVFVAHPHGFSHSLAELY